MKLFNEYIEVNISGTNSITTISKEFFLKTIFKKLIPKAKDFDLLKYVELYLLRRGYIISTHKLGYILTKEFTYVIINETTKEVIVCNDKQGNKGSYITGITGLILAVNYYERI